MACIACIFFRESQYASGAGEEFDTAAFFAVFFVITVVLGIIFANNAHLPLVGDMSMMWGAIAFAVCALIIIVIFAVVVSRAPFNRRRRFPTHIETMVELHNEGGSEAVGAYADIMKAGNHKRPWR